MKTEELVAILAADAQAGASPRRSVLPWLFPALVTSLCLLLLTLGPRPDLMSSLSDPISVMRFVLTLLLGGTSLRAIMILSRPEPKAGVFLPMAGVAVLAAGLWVWTWSGMSDGSRQMAVLGKTVTYCLTTIPLLSILPAAVLLAFLRKSAPSSPFRAGLAAGLAASGLSAALYAVHCTEDSPLFYITWYGLAIVVVTLTSGIVGSKLLRW